MEKMRNLIFVFLSTTSHEKWNISYKDKLKTCEIFADHKKDQKHIQNPVQHLKWSFFPKIIQLLTISA